MEIGGRLTQVPQSDEPNEILVSQILDTLRIRKNRNVIRQLLGTVLDLSASDFQRLNLKIASESLKELAAAFRVFEPYHLQRKITLFGSARTNNSDPSYAVAREIARLLALEGWMTITGAGRGIMQAGLEGAGPQMSFGINIKLPFEQGANPVIANDPKLVEMKYFFTRKVMLVKESDGFIIMPGGFGTLDETFELLTLIQTGKAQPAPIVLLDADGGSYWEHWQRFIKEEVITRGMISVPDESLYLVTQDIDAAVREITSFYRNYHSIRWVQNHLVFRLHNEVSDQELVELNEGFADLFDSEPISRCQPSREELSDSDALDLHRISLSFNRVSHGRLRSFIDALNRLPSSDTK